MGTFDAAAAKAAGYSDDEIAQYLQQNGHEMSPESARAMSHTTPQAPSGFLLYDPTEGMSTVDRLGAGAGRGLVHTARAVANLAGAIPDSVMTDEKALDAPLLNTRSGAIGNLIGESAATAPIGGVASMGLGKLGAALASPLVDATVQGGLQGLATSDPGERGLNTGIGALTGGALGANQILVNKLVNGLKRTSDAQALIDRGISLTPGQMNPGGTWNQFENALEHAPLAGPFVKTVRDNAEHQFQATAIGMGAAPGSLPLKPSSNIHDLLQQAYNSYEPLYDQAKGYPVTPQIFRTQGQNVPLAVTFQQAAKAPGVATSTQKSENAWLQDRLTSLPQNPHSEDLLQLRSDIRQRARIANLKTDTKSDEIATINGRAERGVTAALESQLPPDALKALRTADSNYGNYKIVENAVAKSKDNPGGLTPQKLSQGIYESVQDPAYARGAGGPLRQLAQQGTNVFQEVVPPNGKSVAALSLGGAGIWLHPAVAGAAGTGMAGLVLTPTGRALAAGKTAPQQAAQKLVAAFRGATPATARGVVGQLAQSTANRAGMHVTQPALPQLLSTALMLGAPVTQSSSH